MSVEDKAANDWVLLTSSRIPIAIEILKGRLESDGITTVVHNKMDSSYLNFGDVELHVRRSDYLKAKLYIDG